MFSLSSSAVLLALSASVVGRPSLQVRDATKLSPEELASYAPYTQFARAAYCPSSKIDPWACGKACDANADFQPKFTGGDGDDVQFYYVGYWPTENAVVVAHQGTDPEEVWAVITDLKFDKQNLNSTLFPGVTSDVLVHIGFAEEHEQTAATILDDVNVLLSSSNASTVITVGHSLGGALAELDALFFTLNLPPSIHVKGVTYGTPRVGNAEWASLFDAKVPDFVHINNMQDPVPVLPFEFLHYRQPHGEIHIVGPGEAYSCSGDDDDDDPQCTTYSVSNIFEWDVDDHTGPYDGIYIGTAWCN